MVLAPTKRRLNLIHGTSKPGDGWGGGSMTTRIIWYWIMIKPSNMVPKYAENGGSTVTHRHVSSRSRKHNKKKWTNRQVTYPWFLHSSNQQKGLGCFLSSHWEGPAWLISLWVLKKFTKRCETSLGGDWPVAFRRGWPKRRCNHHTCLHLVWTNGWWIDV